MMTGCLSGCQAGANSEKEAEEKHTTGSEDKGPEAIVSLANAGAAQSVRKRAERSEVRSFCIEISLATNTGYVCISAA